MRAREESEELFSALVGAPDSEYAAPPFFQAWAGKTLEWRIIALDAKGAPVARSDWRGFQIQ